MDIKSRRFTKIVSVSISILIAICIVFLIQFTNMKFDELINSADEAVLVHQDTNSPIQEELATLIMEYKPDACKMIEVYTSDFQPIISFQFLSADPESEVTDSALIEDMKTITSYPELVELFKENEEGYTTIQIGDTKEDVYFHWVTMATTGEENLAIMYMSRPVVHDLWIFSFVCYMILILVFVLVMYLILSQNDERIKNYQRISNDVQNTMKR